ncbi:MAG: hypothetical protein FWE94_05025 [Coriobacteriia bacterium]|nr:hypothetical protein [Coriobacteriia bacterium]
MSDEVQPAQIPQEPQAAQGPQEFFEDFDLPGNAPATGGEAADTIAASTAATEPASDTSADTTANLSAAPGTPTSSWKFNPQRWEYLASAATTSSITLFIILASRKDIRSMLPAIIESIPSPAAMLLIAIRVPPEVWWLLNAALAALLFWIGVRLSKKWGSLMLFIAPVAMLALHLLIPEMFSMMIRPWLPAVSRTITGG